MKKILFVCHGNICRSPMAEAIMRKLCHDRGLEKELLVGSRATSDEEIIGGMGNPLHPDARSELAFHGIPTISHRATKLIKSDYAKYDLFIGMDTVNIKNMLRIFGADPEGKVKKLLDYTEEGGDVADPWYTDRFDIAFADIERGCLALLKTLCDE